MSELFLEKPEGHAGPLTAVGNPARRLRPEAMKCRGWSLSVAAKGVSTPSFLFKGGCPLRARRKESLPFGPCTSRFLPGPAMADLLTGPAGNLELVLRPIS